MSISKNTLPPEQWQQISDLLEPKIKPIVEDFKTRYRLHGRPFRRRDFFRICTLMHIDIANGPEFRFMADYEQIHGATMRLPNGTRAIYLRSFFEADLDLFTAGHELAHAVMHTQGTKPTDLLLKRKDNPDALAHDQRECEADYFAQLLLQIDL